MALVHEFERSGNWLFKRRSWLPLFLVATGIVMMYLGNRQAIFFDLRDEMIFLGVSLLGELIRILTVGFAPKRDIRPEYGRRADSMGTECNRRLFCSKASSLSWQFFNVARSRSFPEIRLVHSVFFPDILAIL